MIVLKFGGSSVDGAAGIERVVKLIRERLSRRPVVVVSAMAKTTRRLLDAAQAATTGDLLGARAIAAEIADFHVRAARPVTPAGSLDAVFAEHFGDLDRALAEIAGFRTLTPRDEDRVAGFGELLSSALLAQALGQGRVDATHVDCRRVIVTDDGFTRARPDYAATDARLRAALPSIVAAGGVPVLGGYVGATREGVTTTLGKEGSDFSAAIVGAALGADEVQIWTDVDGILTADPRLVPGARVVPTLSFAEALELACSGSKKPHPGTIEPASRGDVPIRILNSRNPAASGTLIGRREAGPRPRILSLACRTAAPLSFGLPAEVSVPSGRAVISLVSEDLATSPELVRSALEAAAGYEPRLAREGAAPAVRFLVAEADAPRVLAELHTKLIREEDWA
ncbi:MAG TPA: aspartate kinase [Thermoanaerobaculia bacterium]|jgi:aspartate kinase|nr:aspartate kinase [Thermoanaerobaculia bacterium]